MSTSPGPGTVRVAVCAAVICLLNATGALAQMEEITVTARKVEESLQDVPISISALTGEQMRERGIQDNYGVAAFTPNFNTSQRVGRQLDRPTIRGMANPAVRGEPNASYFIDGIFVSSSISTATTQSMERVEVLRGPQSAQFGRATFSGAINYVTRKPTDEFEGDLNLRYGTHDDQQIGAWFSGPIVEEKLLFLVSGNYKKYGGQWKNDLPALETGDQRPINSGTLVLDRVFLVNGPDGNPAGPDGTDVDQLGIGDNSPIGEEETMDVLTKLTWMPFKSSEISLKYAYTKGEDSHFTSNVLRTDPDNADYPNLNCFIPDDPSEPWYATSEGEFCGEQKIEGTINRLNIPDLVYGLTARSPFNVGAPPEETTAVGARPGLERTTHRYMGEWIQDVGDWTSIVRASYSEDEFIAVYDFDKQDVRAVWGLFNFINVDTVEDTAFEWSVASPVDKPVRGRLGVYYYERERALVQRSVTGPGAVFGLSPGTLPSDPRNEAIENTAAFGSISWDFAPDWRLDLEARWAEDIKTIDSGQRRIDDNSREPVSSEEKFTNFTPRVTLNWQATEDMLVYGLAAKGNKPGGFNNEFFRSDVPSEWTRFVLDCSLGDMITLRAMNGEESTSECTQQLKDDIFFAEEEQWTYEVGVKSQWFERRVTANLSAFYIDWINQGLFARGDVPSNAGGTTPITILRNAGRSKITGFELETSWFATDGLFVFLNYGLSDGEFTEGSLPGTAATTGGDGSIVGNTIPDTPEHSVVTGFEATVRAGAKLDGFLRTDFIWETKKYSGASNFNWIGKRQILNLRTGLRADDWSLTFYVQNLTDDDTPLNSAEFVNFLANPISTDPSLDNDGSFPRLYGIIPQRGRDVGVEFQLRWGP